MIYIIWGPPRSGKTFFATKKVLELLKKNARSGRKVFTNYPVIWNRKKEILSSLVWKKEFSRLNITNADIFLDEAYLYYNSREYKGFEKDDHTFFSTNGHNDLDIWLIAQNPARLELIIREMTNIFYVVQKHHFPWSQNPLWFTVEGFLSEMDYVNRYRNENYCYTRERFFPSRRVKNAYDTKYYRRGDDDYEFQDWYTEISEQNGTETD